MLGSRYELMEKVGSGSMGEVWRGLDLALGRVVAVKVLRPELAHDTSIVRRFAAEARIMARLSHPGIAGVYDFGRDEDGTAYLVMTFVEGMPLRELLGDDGTLPPARVMGLVAESAEALHAAHRAGVIHRDVKPVNLMVRENGSVVLTDFGIARAVGNDLTGPGLVLGTACYLAPEQAAGRDLTPAVDVYALGVTAYECLTGLPPFAEGDAIEVARAHIVNSPAPLPDHVPRPIRELVGSMLAKNPELRPTATAVAATAKALSRGQSRRVPVRRALAGPVVEASGGGNRRRVLMGMTAAAVLALSSIAVAAFGSFNDGRAGSGNRAAGDPGYRLPGQSAPADESPEPLLVDVSGAPTQSPLQSPSDGRGGGTESARPSPRPHSSTTPTSDPPISSPSPSTVASSTPPTGPPMASVPTVVGQPEGAAVQEIQSAGFVADVKPTDGSTCPGKVISQDPSEGTHPLGSTVTLTVDRSCPA